MLKKIGEWFIDKSEDYGEFKGKFSELIAQKLIQYCAIAFILGFLVGQI